MILTNTRISLYFFANLLTKFECVSTKTLRSFLRKLLLKSLHDFRATCKKFESQKLRTTQINRCDATISVGQSSQFPPEGFPSKPRSPHHATLRFRRSSLSGFYPLLPITCGSHHAEASYYYVACTQRHNTKKYVLLHHSPEETTANLLTKIL